MQCYMQVLLLSATLLVVSLGHPAFFPEVQDDAVSVPFGIAITMLDKRQVQFS